MPIIRLEQKPIKTKHLCHTDAIKLSDSALPFHSYILLFRLDISLFYIIFVVTAVLTSPMAHCNIEASAEVGHR